MYQCDTAVHVLITPVPPSRDPPAYIRYVLMCYWLGYGACNTRRHTLLSLSQYRPSVSNPTCKAYDFTCPALLHAQEGVYFELEG